MPRLSDENLEDMIISLLDWKAKGIKDPWLLSDGTVVEPLDVLLELRELRNAKSKNN